jgi:GH43 family beta-xylosidase
MSTPDKFRKQIQTTKAKNPIDLKLKKKKLETYTHILIVLNIENNDPFSTIFIESSKILTNLPNLVTHVAISSFKMSEKNKLRDHHQIDNFIGHNKFPQHLHTSLLNTFNTY